MIANIRALHRAEVDIAGIPDVIDKLPVGKLLCKSVHKLN